MQGAGGDDLKGSKASRVTTHGDIVDACHIAPLVTSLPTAQCHSSLNVLQLQHDRHPWLHTKGLRSNNNTAWREKIAFRS